MARFDAAMTPIGAGEAPARQLPNYITVQEAPKLDLETYIANYYGITRLNRLQTIAGSSRYLGVDALRLALKEAKQGRNVDKYLELIWLAEQVAPSDSITIKDQDWIESTSRQVRAETTRLENELKGYKNNLIKESIRMGNEELGAFYYAIGDYPSAFRAYSRMREYCTTPKHICELTIKLILTAVAQDNWLHVQSNIYKLTALSLTPTDAASIHPIVLPLKGLALLASSEYTASAQAFLATDPSYASLEPFTNISFPRAVISPNDIAIYGALLALATMTRAELTLNVLENADFRTFLELEPYLRRAVADFVSGKYTSCLKTLEAYRADYTLDVYLQRHVAAIYALVRRKSMVAYFAPYSRVAFSTLAAAFGVQSEDAMVAELGEMIRDGSLGDARLDYVERQLVAGSRDRRVEVGRGALEAAKKAEKDLRLRLWKINMVENGLVLKGKKEPKEGMGYAGGAREGLRSGDGGKGGGGGGGGFLAGGAGGFDRNAYGVPGRR